MRSLRGISLGPTKGHGTLRSRATLQFHTENIISSMRMCRFYITLMASVWSKSPAGEKLISLLSHRWICTGRQMKVYLKDSDSRDTVRATDWVDAWLIWGHIHRRELSAPPWKRIWQIFYVSQPVEMMALLKQGGLRSRCFKQLSIFRGNYADMFIPIFSE